eukprot:7713492-Alexandrium_andersonii.AAC.1
MAALRPVWSAVERCALWGVQRGGSAPRSASARVGGVLGVGDRALGAQETVPKRSDRVMALPYTCCSAAVACGSWPEHPFALKAVAFLCLGSVRVSVRILGALCASLFRERARSCVPRLGVLVCSPPIWRFEWCVCLSGARLSCAPMHWRA